MDDVGRINVAVDLCICDSLYGWQMERRKAADEGTKRVQHNVVCIDIGIIGGSLP